MAEIVHGNREGKVLIYQDYRYQKNQVRLDKIYWRCWHKHCRMGLTINGFDIDEVNPTFRILSLIRHHNHPRDDDEILQRMYGKQIN